MALVVTRGRPSIDSDAGIFLSVAARLLAGDRLYADVYDNKDPLFFYTYAAALAAGGWKAPFALDVLWLMLAAGGAVMLLRTLGASLLTVTLGLVTYPLLLTGSSYYAGYSMLPALALAPVIGWLWLRGRFGLSGALLGVAMLYKANLALMLAALPAGLGLIAVPRRVARRDVALACLGLGSVLVLAALALALRGELVPYGQVLLDNLSYADDVLVATGRPTGVYGHLWSLAGVTEHTPLLLALYAVGTAASVWTLARKRRDASSATSSCDPRGPLSALFLLSGSATGVTLAATAVWDHHAQMLALPAFLFAALAASTIEKSPGGRVPRTVATLVTTVLVLWASGALSEPHGLARGGSWSSSASSTTAKALEQARAAQFPERERVSYAVLGRNHEQAHAAFLHGQWKLACPRFHQYPWSPRLDEVVSCLAQRRPDLILVVERLAPRARPRTPWDAFLHQASAFLSQSYLPLPVGDSGGSVEVWALAAQPFAQRSSVVHSSRGRMAPRSRPVKRPRAEPPPGS
jgi:hypothetical protein